MIAIIFNRPEFEYDVHSLVKAFFPREEVEMYYTCEESELAGQKAACTHHGREELDRRRSEGAWTYSLSIDYGERIRIVWQEEGAGYSAEDGFEQEADDRIGTKRRLARSLYRIFSAYTGTQLPWGTLIGIRPTKIPMKLMEEGRQPEEIAEHMKAEHLVSDEKIRLAIEIAGRERRLLARLDPQEGYSLYIGIPFCPSTCLYCSFTSYPLASWAGRVDEYLGALEREIDYAAERFRDRKLNSVYIGGGTPTTLEPCQLDRLIGRIRSSFDLGHCLEFTVEAGRPDSITGGKLEALRRNGISRISINPQTMKQETLDLIGRRHTVEQTVQSFKMAREMGFDNINMDLIIGLPGEEMEDVRRTLEVVSGLKPDNVTIHSLAVKRAARLNILREAYQKLQMVNTQEHMQMCEQFCRDIGLAPYYLYRQKGMAGNLENVGYAAEGKAGIYNILIMEEVQSIVALGAGSISKMVCPDGRIGRCENVKDVGQYIARIEEMIGRKRALFG